MTFRKARAVSFFMDTSAYIFLESEGCRPTSYSFAFVSKGFVDMNALIPQLHGAYAISVQGELLGVLWCGHPHGLEAPMQGPIRECVVP